MKISTRLIARNLLQAKSNTLINIIGLTISFTCAFAILIWIRNEFSYDKHLPDADRIYRLTFETNFSGNRMHFARCWEKWISQMPAEFPQIEQLVRLQPYRHTALKVGENKFFSDMVFATDSNFFSVFGIGLTSGDPETVLNQPHTAVISSTVASRCFGSTDPVGKVLLLSGDQDEKMTPYTIKGVMKDSPVNSHIHFDVITSFVNRNEPPDWAYVYLLLTRNSTPDDVLKGMPAFIQKVEKEIDQKDFTPYLQKITDIHLYSDKDREIEVNGNISNIYLFGAIALMLLLISWVNYYNLSKVRLLSLQKQIFIKRICGSGIMVILTEYILESLFCVTAALILSINLLDLGAGSAGSLIGIRILPEGMRNILEIWPVMVIVTLVSVLAGWMPVFLFLAGKGRKVLISGAKPQHTASGLSVYGFLVMVQLCLSLVLMISALTIYRQKELIFSSGMGNMSSDIIALKKLNWEVRGKYFALRDRALRVPGIQDFTAAMEEPSGETMDAMEVESPELDENHRGTSVYVLPVEDNFIDFFDLKLIAGRNFSKFNPSRKGEDYILNEAAVKKLGWKPEEAIGKPFSLKFGVPDIIYGGTVTGVVHDFNFTTVRQEIKPYALFQKPIFYICYLVRIDPAHKAEAIESLKKIWDEELPDYPFQYEFLSDLYRSAYKKEFSQAKLTAFFSVFAILIICLGLFSVTSVLVARRTKETGIRKVSGATTADVLLLLNARFVRWFAVAFVVACPIGWLAMNKWLQAFTLKTEISWWIFAIAGAVVLMVTLCTVSLQSWSAARKNPSESLRYE